MLLYIAFTSELREILLAKSIPISSVVWVANVEVVVYAVVPDAVVIDTV